MEEIMANLSIEELLAKARKELIEITDRRDALNKHINDLQFLVRALTSGNLSVNEDKKDDQRKQVELVATPSRSSVSRFNDEMQDLMLNSEREYNVPGIVKAIMDKHPNDPDADYAELSKKASNLAYRLEKRGKIEIVKRGIGKKPNLFKSKTKYNPSL